METIDNDIECTNHDGSEQPIRPGVLRTGTVFQRDQTPPGKTKCGEKVPHTDETVSVDVVVRPGGAVLWSASRSDGQNHATQSDSGGIHVVPSGCLT